MEETIGVHVRVSVIAPVHLLLPDDVGHPAGIIVFQVAQAATSQTPHYAASVSKGEVKFFTNLKTLDPINSGPECGVKEAHWRREM